MRSRMMSGSVKLILLGLMLFLLVGIVSATKLAPSTKYINIQTDFEQISITLEKFGPVDYIAHCPMFANNSCPSWVLYNTTIKQNSTHVSFDVWDKGAFIGVRMPQSVNKNLSLLRAMLEAGMNITITKLNSTADGLFLEFKLPITGKQKVMQVNDAVVLMQGLKNETGLKKAQRVQLSNITYNNDMLEMGTDVVAIKAENFTQASLKIPKTGDVNTIMKCSDWNFSTSNCNSWVATDIEFRQDDSFVYFNVTGFSAYGGVELTVLNVQSYPMVGDIWTTRLVTKGNANLTIEGVNGTVFGEDLEFDSLRCGDVEIQTTPIQNGVFVENYSCDDTTYHRVKVLSTGRHKQKFTFGDVVAYSKNLANQMPNIISVEGKLTNNTDDNQNGTFNMTFRIYDVATGGNYLWKENIEAVSVDEGIFTARLGETNQLDLDWNVPYYLEVQVTGDNNMTPRINLSSTPYSKSAERSFNLTCTDCIDETQIDTSGAFVIEGSLNITSKNLSMHGNAIVNLADPLNAQDAATKAYVDAQVGGATTSYGWTNSSGSVHLTTSTDEVNITTLYVDNSNGKVGIGTYTPQAELHVVGNINVTSNITSSNYRIEESSNAIIISASGSKPMVLTTDRSTWI